jgi:hypothetical protein
MKKSNTFEVCLVEMPLPYKDGVNGMRVKILIDGEDILPLVARVELPFLLAEQRPKIEEMRNWPSANRYTLRALRGTYYSGDGTCTIVDCSCDCEGCWPLSAKIIRKRSVVKWKNFVNYHRARDGKFPAWLYKQLGPFQFERRSYDRELKKLQQYLKTLQNS